MPRPFGVFLASQVASQSGTWLEFVALAWLAAELTGSGTALGWIAAATFGPLPLLGPLTGTLTDRVDKHRLLITTQLLIVGRRFGPDRLGLGERSLIRAS